MENSQITEYLASITSSRSGEIKNWFAGEYSKTAPFFYSSVDIRHSGHKIVPVDTNLFPAGFNLLSEASLENAVTQIRQYFSLHIPHAKKILLIPENHTRNLNYLENVAVIKELLEKNSFEVRIGGLGVKEDIILKSVSERILVVESFTRNSNCITLDNFTPDVILVNNDLSSGAPEILQNITQPVIPPVGMGWYRRRKTSHFNTYDEIARKFAVKFGFDEWLISTIFHRCGSINFKERKGLECVALGVEKTLYKIRKKYESYGITDEPYVFIKADSGTYGMGIMTVRSPDELLEINKKIRNKMNAIKEGVQNSEVIIQEGVPTVDVVQGKVAEPLIYLINGKPVGCTYRLNENHDIYGNLNSKGMSFSTHSRISSEKPINEVADKVSAENLCPAEGLVAELASLAAARECYEPLWDI